MSIASMKASYMKEDVAAVARLPHAVADRVRQRCRGAIDAVSMASRADWLPMSLDIELTEAIAAEAGEDALKEQARIALRTSMQGPLLRPLVDVTIRVFGAYPHAALKIVPKAWPMIFHNTGTIHYVGKSAKLGALRLTNPCDEMMNSHAWQVGTAGTFDELASSGGATGVRCEVGIVDGVIEWNVSWL